VKFRALLRKGIVRRRLERDATVTAAKLAQQPPGAERGSLARHLKRVQLALRRMRYRDYGLCAACGRPISDARLRLMPTAGACTACQKELDAEARAKQR
jgi:RNA polymerase-binding transcription factor DksA